MRHRARLALAAVLLIAGAAFVLLTACSPTPTESGRRIPTAPALDGVPCDSAKGGPILGGGGRC